MTSINISHFLLCPIPAWGHIRPFCTLATRLVREQETIVVTFLVAPQVLDKTKTEVSRQFLDEPSESSKALQRIRILSPSDLLNGLDPADVITLFADAYPSAYQTLYETKPITCSVTGTTFDAIPQPCAVILDFFAIRQLQATRAVSGRSVPIISLIAAGAGAIIRLFGPEYIGGLGDVGSKIDEEVARTGLSEDEIGPKMFRHTEGKLLQIPGLPGMYDYEFYPQKATDTRAHHRILIGGYTSFQECDAAIVTTSYAYESASLDAVKRWFSDMQKEVHVLGPLLPAGFGTETQNSEEGSSVDIETFLGEMLVQHGKRSVFFVSFGSFHWPSVPEYVDELIEALIAKKVPFIFAYASPSATISEPRGERIRSSGLGMLTKWSPQQSILNHPATGWFVTHAGFNSVTESFASGIPLICWPLIGDQPVAAAHVTENLHAGFELFQVRSGEGLKPVYRNGITPAGTREAVGIEVRQTIDLCRGEKGQEVRSNAEKLKVEFAKAWEEDGAARQEIRKLLHKYT